MADFVAVIRRAVDGLSDNTPELRAKVYEKARGAVLRQLESMKPRPPEEMLRRQIDKLEAAIQEVEAEHAEALPVIDEPEVLEAEAQDAPSAVEDIPATAPDMPAPDVQETPAATVEAEPTHDASPAYPVEAHATDPAVAEPAPAEAPPAPPEAARPYLWGDESWAGEGEAEAPQPQPAPSYHPVSAPEPVYVPEPEPVAEAPVWHQPQEPEPVYAAGPDYEPAEEPRHAEHEDEEPAADFPVQEPTTQYAHGYVAPEVEAAPAATLWPEGGVDAAVTASPAEEPWAAEAQFETDEPMADAPLVAAAVVHDPLSWQQAQERASLVDLGPEPAVHGDLAAAAQDSYDPPVLKAMPEDVVVTPAPVRLEDETPVAEWVQVREPQADGSFVAPAPSVTAAEPETFGWQDSPFSDVPLREKPGQQDEPARATDDWEQYEDFAGFGEADVKAAQEEEENDDALFAPVEKPARSFRVQPKRRIDLTSVGLGLLGLLLVAGSGYGAWVFRDTLSGLVTGLVSSPQDAKQATKPASTTTPAAGNSSAATPASTTPAQSSSVTKPAATPAVAPEPVEAEVQKFTQRLNPDGSEVDEGKAAESAITSVGEGKSVAPQTVASTEPAPAAPPAKSQQAPAPAAIPVGVSQKMFLYEERVGQTSPVAVEGAVVWSLKHELADNGKNEALVQGQVTAPDRGLSALITFKRNLDPSLPASHLVELVFSLPKNFDGGAIESVQRVSMKQTEQDRGDPLVAVPAKITDDFHMIALNDYADARAFNLKLLQTRDWIDIPLTYRNGRRALLTMQKGTTGAEAFTQAIAEWQAEDGPAAGAVPQAGSVTGTQPATSPAANPAPASPPSPAPSSAPAVQAPANP